MAIDKKKRLATESLTFLVILLGIFVAANVLVGIMGGFVRADWTHADLFSLSEGSKRVAKKLDDRMEVIMYFTEELPPPFNATERYVRDILTEYETASGGKVDLKVVHPDKDDEKEAAQRDGAQVVQHQVIENDGVSVKEGYRSVVIKYLGDKKVINVGRDTTGLEYELTLAMKELVGDKRTVGILKTEGGPTLGEELASLRSAMPVYELKEVSADELSSELAALLIVGPTSKLSGDDLKKIDKYVMEGGNLGVFGGGIQVKIPTQQAPGPLQAEPVESDINRLLSHWGIRVNKNVVADANCDRVPMPSSMGLRVLVPYPPMPVLSFDEGQQEHPALFRIGTARFPFASALERSDMEDPEVRVDILGRTSENSWLMGGSSIDLQPKQPREWTAEGPRGPFPVLAAIEGKLPSAFAAPAAPMSSGQDDDAAQDDKPLGPARATKDARVFVSGWGMTMVDQFLQSGGPGGRQNLNGLSALTLNAVDWLAQDSDLIAIRAKDVEDPTLEIPKPVGLAEGKALEAEEQAKEAVQEGDRAKAEEAIAKRDEAIEERKKAMEQWERTKAVYRWGNVLGIPALFAVFGVIRWRMRVSKKKNIKL